MQSKSELQQSDQVQLTSELFTDNMSATAPKYRGLFFQLKLLHLMFLALEVPGSVPVVLTTSSAVTQRLQIQSRDSTTAFSNDTGG